MDYIQVKENTGLKRFGIRAPDGQDTGEYIEIDLEDLELPLKANECQKKHVENFENFKKRMQEAAKKSDTKNENELISEQQKEVVEAYKEFYEKEEEALDTFLGQGATKKLLCGRKPYLSMYDDINESLEQIMPVMKDAQEKIEEKIKAKYQNVKEDNIL